MAGGPLPPPFGRTEVSAWLGREHNRTGRSGWQGRPCENGPWTPVARAGQARTAPAAETPPRPLIGALTSILAAHAPPASRHRGKWPVEARDRSVRDRCRSGREKPAQRLQWCFNGDPGAAGSGRIALSPSTDAREVPRRTLDAGRFPAKSVMVGDGGGPTRRPSGLPAGRVVGVAARPAPLFPIVNRYTRGPPWGGPPAPSAVSGGDVLF